jgi:hypothetical protein
MNAPISLLPSNSTPWETAHELTDAARWAAIDPMVITRTKDALLCEQQFLALLGWERSVDLWFDDWSEEKRRYVVDKWFEFERLKGTPEGFSRFYGLAGSKLLKVTSPPQMPYPRRGWTDAERLAYLAQFQQIRIYPKVPAREFQRGMFVASEARSKAFVGRVAPTAYRITIDTVVREARLYDPATDAETVLTRREIVRDVTHVGKVYEFEDIVLPARRNGFYVGDFLDGKRYLGRDNAPERVIRTEIERPYGAAVSRPQWSSVVPTARLISIYPDLMRERFVDRGHFIGRASTGLRTAIYPARDKAWQHVYERFYMYDRKRDRGVTAGEPGCYVGHARLGMMPFTAEMKVEIRGKRRREEFTNLPGQYLTRDNRTSLDRALEATRACKAARDTIYLQTQTRRSRRFGDRMMFGDELVFGTKVETN